MDRGNDYDGKRLAELLGSYIRLRRKVKSLSTENLRYSKDYQQLLQIEHNLRGLILAGETLMEMGEFTHLILSDDDVRGSLAYQKLQKEFKTFYRDLSDMSPLIKDRLEDILKTSPTLLEIIRG